MRGLRTSRRCCQNQSSPWLMMGMPPAVRAAVPEAFFSPIRNITSWPTSPCTRGLPRRWRHQRSLRLKAGRAISPALERLKIEADSENLPSRRIQESLAQPHRMKIPAPFLRKRESLDLLARRQRRSGSCGPKPYAAQLFIFKATSRHSQGGDETPPLLTQPHKALCSLRAVGGSGSPGQRLLFIAKDFDAAFEISPVVNRHARRHQVSHHVPCAANIDLFASVNLPVELSSYHHLLGGNIRLHLAVLADGQRAILQIDRPFKLAVNRQVLVAGKLSFQRYRAAQICLVLAV